MRNVIDKFEKFFEFLQFVCTTSMVFYAAFWFYKAFSLPFDFAQGLIEFLPEIARGIFSNPSIDFQGNFIDMSYLIVTVFLFLLNFGLVAITKGLQQFLYEYDMSDIRKKEQEEDLINNELKYTHVSNTMEYTGFLAILKLHLEYSIEKNMIEGRELLSKIRTQNYDLIRILFQLSGKARAEVNENYLIFSVEDFDKFDEFVSRILQQLKDINKNNKEKSVKTYFYLCADAVKSTYGAETTQKLLEKIMSFKYHNQIVVTTNFVSRYEYSKNRRLEAHTMGTSRFFGEKHVSATGEITYDSEDIELYSLKFAKNPEEKQENGEEK